MSQTTLWAQKTGRVTETEPTPWDAPHIYVGRVLEGPVREMYQTYSGRTVTDGVTLLADLESPVLLASTDGEQTCQDRCGKGVYEGKVTTVFRRRDWFERVEDRSKVEVENREIVPLHYLCQIQHYLACTGLAWGSVACFMQADSAPIHWRDVERHDAFISDMRERAARWWRDHVVADVPPDVDDDVLTEDALRDVYATTEAICIQLPAAFAAVFDRLEAIADFSDLLKRERQALRNLLISTIGPAALAVIADDGRGWSMRGKWSRSLRSLTSMGIERARARAKHHHLGVVDVPRAIHDRIDELYSLNMRAFAPGQKISSKAVHLAHLAALAAKSVATE